jgi:hypothetical protein
VFLITKIQISTVFMAFSIQYWANYTKSEVKLQRKSENAIGSNHVLSFSYDSESKVAVGVVQASMRDRSYKVQVEFQHSVT